MPCLSGYETPYSSFVPLAEHDKVTRIACALYDICENLIADYEGVDSFDEREFYVLLENHSNEKKANEIQSWIEEHKKKDSERKAKLKESALSKLTDEEKEALGL